MSFLCILCNVTGSLRTFLLIYMGGILIGNLTRDQALQCKSTVSTGSGYAWFHVIASIAETKVATVTN